jgi:hypothetical protein
MLNLNDPASIRAWLAIAPERHRAQLRMLYRLPLYAAFRDAMVEGAR